MFINFELKLQNLFSTGSFSGSLTGVFTGSLSGSLTGTIIGTGTSPQFVGTSSWANSSSISISSSYSDFSNSSSYALSSSRATTASYALNSNAGDLSGAGTINYIPIWTGNKTLGSTNAFYAETGYFTSTQDLKIQKASPALFVTGSGGGASVESLQTQLIRLPQAGREKLLAETGSGSVLFPNSWRRPFFLLASVLSIG